MNTGYNKDGFDKYIHQNELKLRLLLTNGCNLSCSFCLNDFQPKPSHGADPSFMDPVVAEEAIRQYVKAMDAFGYPKQVYFSGGEPTLHYSLPYLASIAYGLGARVTINTNGRFSVGKEEELKGLYHEIHFGTYCKDDYLRDRIVRMGGVVQCVYSIQDKYVNDDFVEFYAGRGIKVKIFQNFFDPSESYAELAQEMSLKWQGMVGFRFLGKQINRGHGCEGCGKNCVTLKAAWVMPDGRVSPCPQDVWNRSPVTDLEWVKIFSDVRDFHG